MSPDESFLQPDGHLNTQLYWKDHLHLVTQGHHKLAASISTAMEQLKDESDFALLVMVVVFVGVAGVLWGALWGVDWADWVDD